MGLRRPIALLLGGALLAVLGAGCGLKEREADLVAGKRQFAEKCGACHKLRRAGTQGTQGPDLDEAFRQALAGRAGKIKPLLLDQEIVAGLGNIYADEALYLAGIHPERAAKSLKPREIERLHRAIVETLAAAVEAGGSSVRSYVNGQGEMGMFQHRLKA